MNNLMIGLGIFAIIISELIYIYICSRETKEDLKKDDEWVFAKIVGLIGGVSITGILYGGFLLLKNNTRDLLVTITIVLVVLGFFMINKKIGIAVAKNK